MPETIFWWVFTFTCAFAFFFSYGMVEDLIRKWIKGRPTTTHSNDRAAVFVAAWYLDSPSTKNLHFFYKFVRAR